jgi:DNA alkylation repair enzyme
LTIEHLFDSIVPPLAVSQAERSRKMMRQDRLDHLLQQVEQTQHGFTSIRNAADEIVHSSSHDDIERLAQHFMIDHRPHVRMLSTLLFGRTAATSNSSLQILRTVISHDPDWRVQEMLAQAFDGYCAAVGYEDVLPVISDWLVDPVANARRAVTEGLRIWTSRPYFKTHPGHAVQLLSGLRADPSEYVRKSVGNALRDISRKHSALIRAEVEQWDRSHKPTAQTYKLASKFLSEP